MRDDQMQKVNHTMRNEIKRKICGKLKKERKNRRSNGHSVWYLRINLNFADFKNQIYSLHFYHPHNIETSGN